MNWTELSADQLIRACCTSEVVGAWEEFMRRYHALITAAAVRVARTWGDGNVQEVDDIVQEIYLKFCADCGQVLAGFRSGAQEKAVYGYIKVVATNAARDFFRRRRAEKRGARVTEPLEGVADCLGLAVDMDLQVTLSQIDGLLQTTTEGRNAARDRAIFHFYYRDGMTAQAISGLPGIGLDPKGVEGVLHRLTSAMRKAVREPQETGLETRSQKGGRLEA